MRTFLSALLTLAPSLFAFSPSFAQGWQWSRHFGGPGHDYGQIGIVDAAGNVYCFGDYAVPGPGIYYGMYVGNDTLEGSQAGFVTKHDGAGNLIWALNIACDNVNFQATVNSMAFDTTSSTLVVTGGHAATCHVGSTVLPDSGAYLAMIDLSGNCLSAVNIGSPGTDGLGLAFNEQGELFVAGVAGQVGAYIGSEPIPAGSFIAKFSSNGDQLWAKPLITGLSTSGQARFYPYTLKWRNGELYMHGPAWQYSNSNVFEADTVQSAVNPGAGYALLGLDGSNGTTKWMRVLAFIASGSFTFCQNMDISESGMIYCIGQVNGDSAHFAGDTTLAVSASGISAYLAVYSDSGERVRLRTYGPYVALFAIDATEDGSLLMLGQFFGTPAGVDICNGDGSDMGFIMRCDSAGQCVGNTEYITGGYGISVAGSSDGIYLTATSPEYPQYNTITFMGESVTSYGFEDVLLGKLDQSLGVQSLALGGNDGLSIYANPNQGSFQIQVPDALVNSPHLELRIYDATGRLVLTQPMGAEDHPHFDLYGIGSGLYAVTLSNGKRVYHGNMVVE